MLFIISPKNVFAVSYEETTQDQFLYNISNFYLEGNNIIINGWAVTNAHQHLTGSDTHEYSIELKNKTNNQIQEYVAELKNVDKTRLMRASEAVNPCTEYYSTGKCHYKYTKVGFEFKIPTSNLDADTEYDIKLRIYEKQVNRRMQISIYALGISNSYELNDIRYQLYSDIKKTSVIVNSHYLFVRSGPGQNYSIRNSNISCSANGKTLYWYPSGTFSNVLGARQNNPGAIDSELWVNLGFNFGGCVNGKARAVNGTSQNGWGPWVYMIGDGSPAVIKTTALNTFTIEEMRTYTAEKNTNTKALITINSKNKQDLTIKGYHDGALVYNQIHNISGTQTIQINYKIPNTGTFKVEVSNKYRTHNLSSNIYVSSKEEFYIDKNTANTVLTVNTPIMVLKNKNNEIKEYREKIQLSAVPYEMNISQGRGLSGITSAISYWYPLEEFALNTDYNVYALYPSSEETQNYEIVNGKVKINLKKDAIQRNNNMDVSYFHHPNVLLSVIKGELYNESLGDNEYYNGGGIWYPAWDDELGTYTYQYIGTNLGVNKITIKRDLSYTIVTKMFDKDTSKFVIKRVKNPDNLNLIYKKTFTYDELKEYEENN